MSDHCHGHCDTHDHHHHDLDASEPRFRRVLWFALLVNAAMFVVELLVGWRAGSTALLADAIDFGGDAANYGVSLWALAAGSIWRSRTALLKGWVMLGFGVFVTAKAMWAAWQGGLPEAHWMGGVGVLALLANVGVAVVLYAYREGDANMRSVWLCTRNDAIGNVLVMLAAAGVWWSGTRWPDLVVSLVMAYLAASAGLSVIRQSRQELREQHADGAAVADAR